MPTTEEVRAALRNVLDPEIGKPIEDVGMLKDVQVEGGTVRVYVLLTTAGCPLKDRINSDVTGAVKPLAGVERPDMHMVHILNFAQLAHQRIRHARGAEAAWGALQQNVTRFAQNRHRAAHDDAGNQHREDRVGRHSAGQ